MFKFDLEVGEQKKKFLPPLKFLNLDLLLNFDEILYETSSYELTSVKN